MNSEKIIRCEECRHYFKNHLSSNGYFHKAKPKEAATKKTDI